MPTKTIMTTRFYTLESNTTVAEAVATMIEHQVRNLPVVDEDGNFIGLFGVQRFIHALLPKVMGMDLGPNSLSDLSFMPEDPTEMSVNLLEIGQHPVKKYLEKKKNLVFCKPNTPLPELLKLIYQHSTSLAVLVVKGKRKKLVGIVSGWDILDKVARDVYVPEVKKTKQSEADKQL